MSEQSRRRGGFFHTLVRARDGKAGRLVMTEQAYFSSLSQKDCFKDLGVEEFEILATLDSHTSEICCEMDGKHFQMKDYEPGTTAPPFFFAEKEAGFVYN